MKGFIMVYVKAKTDPANCGEPKSKFTVQYFDENGNMTIRSGGTSNGTIIRVIKIEQISSKKSHLYHPTSDHSPLQSQFITPNTHKQLTITR